MEQTPPHIPPRLKDVARVAGYSVSGVSRALNGDPGMADATRAHICQVAASMGYEPVAAARSLREFGKTGKSASFHGTLGYLIHPHEVRMMALPEARTRYPWIFQVENRAASHGYSTDFLPINDSTADQGELRRILRARGIRGVIISGRHDDHKALNLDWSRLSAISLSAAPSLRFLNNLSVPYFQDTYFAVTELVRRNYRRIGFVMVGNVLEQFLAGYETAVHRCRLPEIKPLVSMRGVPKNFESWVQKNRLDCVLTTTGLELLEALRATGRRVPEDIGMGFVDDYDAPGLLSGLHQPRVKISSWAVDMLHTMIQRNETGVPEDPVEVHFPSNWSEGTTLRSEKL